jgi:hypothetical protein
MTFFFVRSFVRSIRACVDRARELIHYTQGFVSFFKFICMLPTWPI